MRDCKNLVPLSPRAYIYISLVVLQVAASRIARASNRHGPALHDQDREDRFLRTKGLTPHAFSNLHLLKLKLKAQSVAGLDILALSSRVMIAGC